MRRFAAGFFVGAAWGTWSAVGPPRLGTGALVIVVVAWLLWPDLRQGWTQLTT